MRRGFSPLSPHDFGQGGETALRFFHVGVIGVPGVTGKNGANHGADFGIVFTGVNDVLERAVVPAKHVSFEGFNADRQALGIIALPVPPASPRNWRSSAAAASWRGDNGNRHAGGKYGVEKLGGIAEQGEMIAV